VKKELSVLWCPTGNMIGDCATKPLQGAAFKKFRTLSWEWSQWRIQGQGRLVGKSAKNVGKANKMVW
jgi:hypothetical protein